MFWGDFKNTFTEKENSFKTVRLRVAPHLSSWIVEGAKRERARKSPHARKATLSWGLSRLCDVRSVEFQNVVYKSCKTLS